MMTHFDIFIQWAVLVVCALFMLLRGQLTIFHPSSIYLTFHTLVFCIRPTFIKYGGFDKVWDYMQLTPTTEVLHTTLWLSSFSLIIFIVTFSMVCHEKGTPDMQEGLRITKEMRKAFMYMTLVFAPIAGYSIFGAKQSGEMINGVFVMTGSSGYANAAQQVLIPISIISIVVFKWKWYSYIPFLLFAYHRLSHGYGRWTVILPVLAIIMYYCWVNRKNFPPVRWLIPIPFLFLLFNQMTKNRGYVKSLLRGNEIQYSIVEEKESMVDQQFAMQKQWDTLDFANFDFLAYIVDKVPKETETYTYGTQHLQLFTEPIPRKLWRGKPIGPPIQFFNLNDYGNFLGLTVSIIGDGWMSGGWIGVIINMSLAGVGLGILYKWFIKNQHNIFKVTIYIIINAILLQLFRDGGIVSMAKFMLFTQSPILLWWVFHTWIVKSTDQDIHEGLYETEPEYEQSYY